MEECHWLDLPEGTTYVKFCDLPHLMAKALFPVADEDEECDFHYGAARLNLDEELPLEVAAGRLKVRDPLTKGAHSLPIGWALQNSLVKVSDLEPFLADREVRIRFVAPAAPAVDQRGTGGGGLSKSTRPGATQTATAKGGKGQGKVWTEERKAEVRAYRKEHGLKRTAEFYGVSQATISKHVPAEKESAPRGFSVFSHRSK